MTETHIYRTVRGDLFAVEIPMDEETRDLLISVYDTLVEIRIEEQ